MRLPQRLSGALVLLLAVPMTALTAEWSAEPKISVKSGYNDNIRLTTAEHDSVWETAVTPRVKFGGAEENRGLYGDAFVSVRRFFGGSGRESSSTLDREDANFNINAYHRTLKNEFTGLINLTRDSTLDSELDETGNVIDQRATRIRKTIGPGWSHKLTELSDINAKYSFTTVDFSDVSGTTDLIEYDYHVISASLTRLFTPKIKAALATAYSSYKPETNLDSDTVSIQIGIDHSFTETLTTSWLAGMRRTTFDTTELVPTASGLRIDKDDSDDTGFIYSAGITKLLESGKLSFTANRISTPSSDGDLLDTTRFILTGEHRLTESLRTAISAEYSTVETISSATAGLNDRDNRTLYRIRPRVSWRWQREWEISGQYEYAKKDEDNTSKNATRNAFYLTLTYRPDKIFISR